MNKQDEELLQQKKKLNKKYKIHTTFGVTNSSKVVGKKDSKKPS